MFRRFLAGLAVSLALSPAHAESLLKIAAPPAVSVRAASAEVVVVGKVTAVEKDEIELPQYPGATQKISYKVAVVKIDDTLYGAKNETHIKVAFQPIGVPRRGGLSNFDFKEGAEGLFFLTKNADAGVYTFNYNSTPIEAKAESYKADLELAKKAMAVFADPAKALQAKENADRYFAAAVLVAKYRTTPAGGAKTELVPADESKLILKTIPGIGLDEGADRRAVAVRDVQPPGHDGRRQVAAGRVQRHRRLQRAHEGRVRDVAGRRRGELPDQEIRGEVAATSSSPRSTGRAPSRNRRRSA